MQCKHMTNPIRMERRRADHKIFIYPIRSSIILIILSCMIILDFYLILENPPTNSLEKFNEIENQSKIISSEKPNFDPSKFPLILLYEGPAGAGLSWQSAVWAGWGNYHENMQNVEIQQELHYAAEGVTINKYCDVPCFVTRNQTLFNRADAVVMELVNHYKFNPEQEFNWPAKYEHQSWVLFHFEPRAATSVLEDPLISSKFQYFMTPRQSSNLPITLICDWGRELSEYLLPPPLKKYNICNFSFAVEINYSLFFNKLNSLLLIDHFAGEFQTIEYPGTLEARMKSVSEYKFVIITELVPENDWVSPEWSQAFLSGTVPIYQGAMNIEEYAPGPKSFISVRDFETPEELADHIKFLMDNEEEYLKYFAWKQHGYSHKFATHLNNCAHYGECRICKELHQQREQG